MRRFLLGFSFACTLVALVLMIFTEGIALHFMEGVEYCSYVDHLAFGYGDIFPLLTVIMSVFAVCLFLLRWIRRDTDLFWILWRQGGALLYSVIPLVVFNAQTPFSVLVSILLAAAFLCTVAVRIMQHRDEAQFRWLF